MQLMPLKSLAMTCLIALPALADVSITEKQDHLYQDLSALYHTKAVSENVLISPKNISDLLALLAIGTADGSKVRGELANALGLDAQDMSLGLKEISLLNQKLTKVGTRRNEWDPEPTRLKLATSLWANSARRFEFAPTYVQEAQKYLNAKVQSLNFAAPEAKDTINEWVSEATEKMIPKLLTDLPASAMSVLVSTLFIEGNWAHQFQKFNTKEGDFTLVDGSKKKLPLMRLTQELSYYSGKVLDVKFQYVGLPTADYRARLEVYLPESLEGSDQFKQAFMFSKSVLPPGGLSGQTNVALTLPKFKVGFKDEGLKENLEQILPESMDRMANYSRMSDRALYVGQVIHQTVLEVQENGFRAAAATAAIMLERAMPRMDDPIEVKVDRPFAVRIVALEGGEEVELFKGWVANPEELK